MNDLLPPVTRLSELSPPSPETLRARHPRVEVDLRRMFLVVLGPYPYGIGLESCSTPAKVLDAVFQVSAKTWCDRELAGEVLAAFDTASRLVFGKKLQAVLCPYGQPRAVDWLNGNPTPPIP